MRDRGRTAAQEASGGERARHGEPAAGARPRAPEPAPPPSEALCSALLLAALDPVLVVDPSGRIRIASASVEAALGWPPAELVGRDVRELARDFPVGDETVPNRSRPLELRHRDGRALECVLSLVRVEAGDGGEQLLVAGFHDRSELERARRVEAAVLGALETMGESASILAHEIKNPITAVNMALRAVAQQLGEEPQAVLRDLVQRMQRLENALRRTLGYARPLVSNPADFPVSALLAAAAGDLRGELAERGAALETECAPPDASYRGDRQLLGEALAHLLRNALEAIPDGGHVRLAAEVPAPGALRIAVEDDGPGVPAERAAEIFRPFVTTKPTGAGLGLSFCKKVVEEHGGEIHAERAALGGARLRIELPAPAPR